MTHKDIFVYSSIALIVVSGPASFVAYHLVHKPEAKPPISIEIKSDPKTLGGPEVLVIFTEGDEQLVSPRL